MSPGSVNRENPGFAGVRGSRGETSKDPGVPPARWESDAASLLERAGASAPKVPRRALSSLKHSGHSSVAIAPQVKGVRRELCRRLGVRYQDLTAAGKEAVDLYARSRAKLAGIDRYLERHPMLNEKGEPLPCMALYSTLLNTSSRLLAQVLSVLEQMAREDDRYDAAVQALIETGRKTKAGRGEEER